ncbi:MAG: DUF4783 domain-containing protein [Bacteroidetes bacterium QS_1_63_11]|nr:MAG: DUF4783 domain-containing protein [Bacteroidetes bacterium QS_1_63_11]
MDSAECRRWCADRRPTRSTKCRTRSIPRRTRRLLEPAADRIEISLFGARTFYSSAQALYVLREFFRSHAPRRFVVGNVMETGTTCLVQGAYEEAQAERKLRVYVRLDRPEGGTTPWHLQEVRIEEEVRIEGASN